MLKLGSSTYGRVSKSDLEKRLAFQGKRLILSDIDGTLHEGGFGGKYTGITYIDLAWYLFPNLIRHPKQLKQFSSALVTIFCDERKERNEEKHIDDFVDGLQNLPLAYLHEASKKTATHYNKDAIAFLRKLVRNNTSIALVTKALRPTAEAYMDTLSIALDTLVVGSYNPLLTDNGLIIGLEKKVVTAQQKQQYVADLLAQYNPQQVIAFGDSKEDAPFFSLPYPESSLRIAINPKDEVIKEVADVWSWSWKELDEVFFGPQQPPNGKKKWFLMGLAGAGALVYAQEHVYYNAVGSETGKMCSDWITSRPAKKESTLLVDLHVHVRATTSATEMIAETPKDVDVIALADKSKRDLSFFVLKEKLQKENISFSDKGYLLEIPRKEKYLHVAYAQETPYKGFHILSLGHRTSFLNVGDPLQHAKEEKGIIILAHPYTVENKTLPWLMPYWFYPENEPLPYHDALEAFNAQNMFCMVASNVRARRACERENVLGVAGSDTHGVLEDIGLSGNYFPPYVLDFSSDRAFYASLRKAITEQRFERREHYASPITFVKTIATGHLQWYHLVLFLGVAGCGYLVMKRK